MITLTDEQETAVQRLTAWAGDDGEDNDETTIALTGAAGTGKTTILQAVRALLEPKGVLFTAMTGKAAQRLREATGVEATTLHRILYVPPSSDKQEIVFGALNAAPEETFVVVDEASMVTPAIWQDLQAWMTYGVCFLFVGDPFQLPPVMTRQEKKDWGADFSVFGFVKGPSLTRVLRSGDDVLHAATFLRVEGMLPMDSSGGYSYRRARLEDAVGDWLGDPDSHALVTWRNAVRMQANRLVRAARGYESPLPEPGEPVLFCRNGQGRLNGEIAVVKSLAEGPKVGPVASVLLTVAGSSARLLVTTAGKDEPMDGQTPFLEADAWKAYVAARRRLGLKQDPIPITWGYALTAHKAQGSEFRRVTIFLTEGDTASRPFRQPSTLPDGRVVQFWQRWTYTALTRAKEQAAIVIGG